MFERLEVIKQRNDFITNELTKPEVINDVAKTAKLSKEQSDLSEIIECYNEYLKAKNDYEEAKELANDPELGDIAREEESKQEARQKELEKQLEILLLPKDPNDGKNIIVEIRGAAGGDEANILLEIFITCTLSMRNHKALKLKIWRALLVLVEVILKFHLW